MERPLKLLLGGFATSALLFAVGQGLVAHLESKVRRLEADCLKEFPPSLRATQEWAVLCDAKELHAKRLPHALPAIDVQHQLVAAQQDVLRVERAVLPLAAVTCVFLALPWTWYFLLRRLREVASAIANR